MTTLRPSQQQFFDFHCQTAANFENFCPGNNTGVIEQLKALHHTPSDPIFIYGPSKVGCTHLLTACCHALRSRRTIYIDLAKTDGCSTHMLNDLEWVDCVCWDHIDHIAGNLAWEEALFHAYNRIANTQTSLVVAAHHPPQHIPFQLADLQSRLAWHGVTAIHPLSDEDKIIALTLRAQRNGCTLNPQCARYLVHHHCRDFSALLKTLNQLEAASLQRQQPITIPFIKTILAGSCA